MSKESLTRAVQRSINDAAFRRQLATDASSALRGYELTPDELNAMRSRDAAKLTAFGVEVRMSKTFTTLDPGTMGAASLASGEPRDSEPVWIGDMASTGAGALTANEPHDVAPTWIGDLGTAADGAATDEGQLTDGVDGTTHIQITTGDGDLQQ